MSEGLKTLHFRRALLAAGWRTNVRISVSGGLIAAIAVDVEPGPGDERHAIGLPGMANLHSHAFQRGMAGRTEFRGTHADSFWTWRTAMYRFVDRLDPAMLTAIAALAYAEMLESGFTRVGEFHYLHHQSGGAPYADTAAMSHAILAAAAETGIGMTLLPVFYAHGGFGGTEASDAQRRFVTSIDSYAQLLEQVRGATAGLPDAIVGIAPHSLRAVTERELRALIQLADKAPIHMHIAEQVREVEDCLAWSGQRPVEWLLDHADVGDHWCLVHATHLTGPEIAGIAHSGAVVGLCPVTEANLGDGLFPASQFRQAGGRIGVGSDSNVLIDMSEELRWLEYGQRLATRTRNVLVGDAGQSTGQALFDACLAGGAQALGVPAGLAPGYAADIVSLSGDHPSLAADDGPALIDAFIFAAGRSAVDRVWRRGRVVVSGGRHLARDGIEARYRQALDVLTA